MYVKRGFFQIIKFYKIKYFQNFLFINLYVLNHKFYYGTVGQNRFTVTLICNYSLNLYYSISNTVQLLHFMFT